MFSESLKDFSKRNLLRTIKDKTSPQGREIIINGKELINFSSNDYLGLASNEEIKDSVKIAINKYGFGAGASRLLSGGCILHNTLEKNIASFKDGESGLLFNSGYAVNVGAIPALTSSDDAIFSDELNHASIIDGCRLSKAKKFVYKHNDIDELASFLKSVEAKTKIVITESVFSMDGDIIDLNDINMLCNQYKALLYIDDAHATGVIGGGKGSLKHFQLSANEHIIQMGTFSKALGSVGGFIVATKTIIDYLINTSRSLIYSTALSVADVAASIASLDYIERHPELIEKLKKNVNKCRELLIKEGFSIERGISPIIPVKFKSVDDTIKVSDHLFRNGIYAPSIRPPTVKIPRIRITITASHTKDDIELLVSNLKEAVLLKVSGSYPI